MKPIRTIILAALLTFGLLTFSSCAKNGAPSEAPSVSASQAADNTNGAVPETAHISFVSAGNESGFYSVEDHNGHEIVAYIDYATHTQLPLCGRPECQHSDSSCSAYALVENVSVPILAVINDKLLIVQTEVGADTLPHISVAGLDGSDPKLLCELDSSISVSPQLYTDGANLYALVTLYSASGSHLELYRFDLEDGSYESLCSFADGANGMITSCFDMSLTLLFTRIDEESGSVEDYAQVFHVDTNTLDDPVISLSGVSEEAYTIYNSTLITLDTKDALTATMTFTDLRTGSSIEYKTNALASAAGMSQAALNVYDLWDGWYRITLSDGERFASFNVNPATGDFFPMTLYYEGSTNVVLVFAERGNELLVRADWNETRDGAALTNLSPVYALISKDDYLHCVPNYTYIERLAS